MHGWTVIGAYCQYCNLDHSSDIASELNFGDVLGAGRFPNSNKQITVGVLEFQRIDKWVEKKISWCPDFFVSDIENLQIKLDILIRSCGEYASESNIVWVLIFAGFKF